MSEYTQRDLQKLVLDIQLRSTAKIGQVEGFSTESTKAFYEEIVNKYFESINVKKHPMLSQKEHRVYLEASMKAVFGRQAILFSLDLEAWERNNDVVTEIGISIYDPRGQAVSLFPSIIQIHIRIKEYLNNRNGRFVPDHAVNSISGFSYSMFESEAVDFVQILVNYYFHEAAIPCFLVGHNVKGDLSWLRSLGIHFESKYVPIDTQKLFSISNGASGSSLKRGLRKLEIPHAYLHNGGNDSYYTLLLAMKLCDPTSRKLYRLDEPNVGAQEGPGLSRKERRYRELKAPNVADTVEQTAAELVQRLYEY